MVAAMTTDPTTPSYEPTQEVRLAVTLYGGVSLAIYMNGIAQELLSLVRSTAPAAGGKTLHVDNPRPNELVYRELGQRLQGRSLSPAVDGVAVRTRFVVDLITGTSAGGINGVFLAKALALDLSLDSLTGLWVREGNIDMLLNDAKSEADLKAIGLSRPRSTTSLLNSRRMTTKLLSAIRDLGSNQPAGPVSVSPYADAIDLYITATDLAGRTDVVPTTDQPSSAVTETSNRTVFHFAYDAAEGTNDFTGDYDAMLAFAARATSSFPAAFEPVRLQDVDEIVAAVCPDVNNRPFSSANPNLQRFFPGYPSASYHTVAFADGGYLDNKPFDPILSAIPHRRATLPVDRKLLYVEPDPGLTQPQLSVDATAVSTDVPRPDIVVAVTKAMTLPRNETIRGDVERIQSYGDLTARRKAGYDALARALEETLSRDVPNATTGDMQRVDRLTSIADSSPTSLAHRAVRVARVVADVAEVLARIVPPTVRDRGSDLHKDLTNLVAVARTKGVVSTDAELLEGFDLTYSLRRINHLQAYAVQLAARQPAALPGLTAVRGRLDTRYRELRDRGRAIRRPLAAPATAAAPSNPMTTSVTALRARLGADNIDFTAGRITAEQVFAAIADDATRQTLSDLLTAMAGYVDLPGSAVATQADLSIPGDDQTTALLLERWAAYDLFDQIAAAYEDTVPGENSAIGVYRVSPLDADLMVRDLAERRQKLSGRQIFHFGAFFDESWRRMDILWGRLDGAERIVEAIVPAGDDVHARNDLVTRLHEAILADALADPAMVVTLSKTLGEKAVTSPGDLRTALAHGARPASSLTTEDWLKLSGRASRVANDVTTELSVQGRTKAPGLTAIASVLKLGVNMMELVTGGDVKRAYLRNALVLVMVSGLLFGVGGLLFRHADLARTGFLVALGAFLTRVVLDAVADRLGGTDRSSRFALRTAGVILVIGAILGTFALLEVYDVPSPVVVIGVSVLVGAAILAVADRVVSPWIVGMIVLAAAAVSLTTYAAFHVDEVRDFFKDDPPAACVSSTGASHSEAVNCPPTPAAQ